MFGKLQILFGKCSGKNTKQNELSQSQNEKE